MSVAIAEQFIKRLETKIAVEKSSIDAAAKRGRLTDEELTRYNKLLWSDIPILVTSCRIAAERAGKTIRDRSDSFPNVLEEKGLYVSNARHRPEIFVYGEIGFGGITADEFRSALGAFAPNEPLDLHVHSPGGDFREGVAIHSLIRIRSGAVHGFVDGRAASAGSLILMPCATITMAPASELMIHLASIEPRGSMQEDDLARALKVMKDTNEKLISLYKPRWKGTEVQLRKALEAETYYTPAEAVRWGLCDFISDAVRPAVYEVVTGSRKTPGFAIAASEANHKIFTRRQAALRLWEIELDAMRRELAK